MDRVVAQSDDPLVVEYSCLAGAAEYSGVLPLSLCVPSFGNLRCYYDKILATTQGQTALSASFLLPTSKPSNYRQVCLRSAGSYYLGNETGPLPFGYGAFVTAFNEGASPFNLNDCAVWAKVSKSFTITTFTYLLPEPSSPGEDSLNCQIVIRNNS